MVTELECGFIGLDIVHQLHFCRTWWSTTWCWAAQYVLTGRVLLAASNLLYGLVCRRRVELQIHRLEPQAPDLTSLNVPKAPDHPHHWPSALVSPQINHHHFFPINSLNHPMPQFQFPRFVFKLGQHQQRTGIEKRSLMTWTLGVDWESISRHAQHL